MWVHLRVKGWFHWGVQVVGVVGVGQLAVGPATVMVVVATELVHGVVRQGAGQVADQCCELVR